MYRYTNCQIWCVPVHTLTVPVLILDPVKSWKFKKSINNWSGSGSELKTWIQIRPPVFYRKTLSESCSLTFVQDDLIFYKFFKFLVFYVKVGPELAKSWSRIQIIWFRIRNLGCTLHRNEILFHNNGDYATTANTEIYWISYIDDSFCSKTYLARAVPHMLCRTVIRLCLVPSWPSPAHLGTCVWDPPTLGTSSKNTVVTKSNNLNKQDL